MAGNFQFSLYLSQSGLSESERSNMERIFATLTPERQQAVIDGWPRYLAKLLEIKHYAEEEKKRAVRETLTNIRSLLSDIEHRKKEASEKAEAEGREALDNVIGSEEYERSRRMDALKRIRERMGIPEEQTRIVPADPLANFL